MKLNNDKADIFVPDGLDIHQALNRTTHLAIGAHQDDLEIMAYHGIAECYGLPDKWFTGIVLTNGAGSPRAGVYGKYTDKEMQIVRQREQRKAAEVGEYSCMLQLMYSSSETKDAANNNTVEDIRAILEISRPEFLYLHNPADKHDTHVATMLRSISAVRQLPSADRPAKVYGCEVWRDLDWLSDDDKLALPVEKYPNVASALLGVFDSQISGGKRYDLATMGRRIADATYYASHQTDGCSALTFAMDLTPLITDDTVSVETYVSGAIDKFKKDVSSSIIKLS